MFAPVEQTAGPAVSVIVPARNEEACLRDCLASLVSQAGVRVEILVVNDGSTDRTAEIARSFGGVRVIEGEPPPVGWTGKNNAVWTGAGQATGDWLLFTDADTVHLPGSLARSMAEAQERGADMFSYSPEQEVETFAEMAVMPVIFAELAAQYRPSEVSDPASSAAAANGQYILVRREAYESVGGHQAVAGEILEDVALAQAFKASGRTIFFRYGGDAVRTRMYRNFAQLREGWSKNLVLLFRSPVKLAAMRLTEFGLLLGSLVLLVVGDIEGRTSVVWLAGVAFLAQATFLWRRIRRAHFSWKANLLSPLGLPLFAYLLLRSRLLYKRGVIPWKGRIYGSHQGQPHGQPAAPVAKS
jgi:glycosyltransferase involved in cell wall biosynthesis